MTRELLILRHGKSDWSTGVTDFDRPLQDRGKRLDGGERRPQLVRHDGEELVLEVLRLLPERDVVKQRERAGKA